MQTILDRLRELLDPNRIAEWAARIIPNLILGLFVFTIFYLVYRTINWIVSRVAVTRRPGKNSGKFHLHAPAPEVIVTRLGEYFVGLQLA